MPKEEDKGEFFSRIRKIRAAFQETPPWKRFAAGSAIEIKTDLHL